MSSIKIPSGRPELSFTDVFNLTGWTDDDLFYLASKGALTIHVMSANWNVDHIDEIDNSKEFDQLPSTSQKVTVGNHRIYREFTSFVLSGLQPIGKKSFISYRKNPASAKIEVDLRKVLKLSDDSKEYLFYPTPHVFIREALNDGQLFVMRADIGRLTGLSPDENLSELFEHPNWPKELGIAINAWQAVQYSKEQGVKPSELIRNWLKSKYPTATEMSEAAVKRITTIANWDKTPGPSENLDKDG